MSMLSDCLTSRLNYTCIWECIVIINRYMCNILLQLILCVFVCLFVYEILLYILSLHSVLACALVFTLQIWFPFWKKQFIHDWFFCALKNQIFKSFWRHVELVYCYDLVKFIAFRFNAFFIFHITYMYITAIILVI